MAKKLTDLTGDGKVTRADVLKGRGVPGFAKGKGKKRYAEGGNVEEREIGVTADRIIPPRIDFDLMQGSNPTGDTGPSMPSGGGMPPSIGPMDPRAAMAARTPPRQAANSMRFGKVGTVAGPVYGAEYRGKNFNVGAGLGRGLLGREGAPMFGANAGVTFKKGGAVKKMAKGGSTASSRGDGCATKGKTRGRIV
jgi:hypothetical protein